MAKMAMGNAALFAAVLQIPQLEEVIQGLDTLLVACTSGGFIDVPKFRNECERILDILYDDADLAWNMTNPTLGFFLDHSPDIIAYFQGFGIPISETTEEGMLLFFHFSFFFIL